MLIEFAIGDVYGRHFEFKKPEFIKLHNHLPLKWPEASTRMNHITDDTLMTCAVAQLMIDGKEFTHANLATQFIKLPLTTGGFAKRMRKAIGTRSIKGFLSNGSEGMSSNGCVMRCLPIGLHPDSKMVVKNAIMNASCTHTTMEAIQATVFLSLYVNFIYYGRNIPLMYTFRDFADEFAPGMDNMFDLLVNFPEHPPRCECDAIQTTIQAIRTSIDHLGFSHHPSVDFLIHQNVSIGGDTDTTAALSAALLSLRIPDFTTSLDLSQLSDPGLIAYLTDLEHKLFEKFPRV